MEFNNNRVDDIPRFGVGRILLLCLRYALVNVNSHNPVLRFIVHFIAGCLGVVKASVDFLIQVLTIIGYLVQETLERS